jgi:hypothetical protein
MTSIYHVFIINRAGSLIFDWDNKREDGPTLSANEKIILLSMFYSLYTIAAQLSPTAKSSGIEVLDTTQFRLHCFQSMTGVKFIVVASPMVIQSLDVLLRKIYELYSDYALKNPFYSVDMPIRADKFDEALKSAIAKYEESMPKAL